MTPTITPQTKSIMAIRAILTLIGVLGYASFGAAQSYTIMPQPFGLVQDNSGHIINGGCVWTYLAGTTTAATTYSDNAGTPNTNPIKADSAGRFTAYLLAGSNYKFVYENTPCTVSPPTHGSVLRTADNIAGTPSSSATVDVTGTAGETISAGNCAYLSDGSGGKTLGQWYKCDSANGYSSTAPELGLAPSAITSGSSGTIRIVGSVPGLTSLSAGSSYYVGTAGALTATSPALSRKIGVADTSTSLVVKDVPPQPIIQTTTATGTQNDFALTAGVTVLRCNNATAVTFTGFAAGFDGQTVSVVSIGAGQVNVTPQSASSVAANRVINFATVGNTALAAGIGTATFTYDGTTARWRLVTHDQGAPITQTYAGGDYTANASMTWTVDSGDVTTFTYYLKGRLLTVLHELTATTVGGTASTTLQAALPGGYTAAKQATGALVYSDNGANDSWGKVQISAAAAIIRYSKGIGGGNWTLATNGTAISASLVVEVQ